MEGKVLIFVNKKIEVLPINIRHNTHILIKSIIIIYLVTEYYKLELFVLFHNILYDMHTFLATYLSLQKHKNTIITNL